VNRNGPAKRSAFSRWSLMAAAVVCITCLITQLLPSASAFAASTTTVDVTVQRGGSVQVDYASSPNTWTEETLSSPTVTTEFQMSADSNTTMVIEGSALAGYGFTSYSGSISSSSLWVSFTVGSSSMSITENVSEGTSSPSPPNCPTPVGSPTPTVSISISPFTGGTVSYTDGSLQGTVQPNTESSFLAPACSTVSLQANPSSGYTFDNWGTGGPVSGTDPTTSLLASIHR
jgi:hypothetical protein